MRIFYLTNLAYQISITYRPQHRSICNNLPWQSFYAQQVADITNTATASKAIRTLIKRTCATNLTTLKRMCPKSIAKRFI
jgi:hypothetical protein